MLSLGKFQREFFNSPKTDGKSLTLTIGSVHIIHILNKVFPKENILHSENNHIVINNFQNEPFLIQVIQPNKKLKLIVLFV